VTRTLLLVLALAVAVVFVGARLGWGVHPPAASGGAGTGAVAQAAGDTAGEGPRTARRRARVPSSAPAVRLDETPTEGVAERPWLISGTVRWPDGTPAPRAVVVLGDLDASQAATTADGRGRFALDDYPYYSSLHVVARRGAEVWHRSVDADGCPLRFDLTLSPPGRDDRVVLVQVTGPAGEAVPHAVARAVRGTPRAPRLGREPVVEVADGWFPVAERSWRGPERPVFLVERARDEDGSDLPWGPGWVEVDLAGPPVVEVRLAAEGASLEGRVEAPDGSPAEVWVELDSALPPECPVERPARVARAASDERGRFAFAGLVPGPCVLSVAPRKGVHGGCDAVEVTAGATEVVLRLRRTVRLAVHVTDEQGAPVADAEVTARCEGEGSLPPVRTGADGRTAVDDVPEGSPVRLGVRAAGFVAVSDCTLGPGTAEFRVALARAARVAGRVVGPDGLPFDRAPLAVEGRTEALVTWGPGGAFVVDGVPPREPVTLSLCDEGRVVAALTAFAGDSDVVLCWPREDRLTLVFPPAEGPARDDVDVLVLDRGTVCASRRTSARVVSFPAACLPQVVDVQADPVGEGLFAFLRQVPSRSLLRVEWSRGETLAGRLTAPGGADPGFVPCLLTSDEGFCATFETRLDGRFWHAYLPRGHYTLSARTPDGLSALADLELPGPALEVELRAPVR